MTDRREMEAVIEAILFVSHDPVSRAKLVEVFGERERETAAEALEAVVRRYREQDDRGVMVDEAAGGLRLVTRPDLHGYLKRFFEVHGSNKLTMPALETLAIIAYRQPITAPEIGELRNVNTTGVLKKLLERRLVRIAGRKEVVGKPFLYATTREFLMHFGLRSLKELPPLEQFEELFGDEVEPSPPEGLGPDAEEIADREAAELAEAAEEDAERREAEAVEDERAAAEEAEEPEEVATVAEAESSAAAEEDEPAAAELEASTEVEAAENSEPDEAEAAAPDEAEAAAPDEAEAAAPDEAEAAAPDEAEAAEEEASAETSAETAEAEETAAEPSPEETPDEPASGKAVVAEVEA